MKRGRCNRRGQSTMEYVLIVGVIIAILIAMLANGGPLYAAFQKVFGTSGNSLGNSADNFKNSDLQTSPPKVNE